MNVEEKANAKGHEPAGAISSLLAHLDRGTCSIGQCVTVSVLEPNGQETGILGVLSVSPVYEQSSGCLLVLFAQSGGASPPPRVCFCVLI